VTPAVLAAALAFALPQHGVLVPDKSLGGVGLGTTPTEVRTAWGSFYGVCRGCPDATWYFTYRPFTSVGAAVTFRAGRAIALFTLWAPPGWRTSRGLTIGEPEARVTAVYGALPRVECGAYSALIETRSGTTTAFYVRDGRVWGFGLSRAAVPACR
jgi:hypothetical protein